MHYKKGMRINVTSNNKYIENQRDNYINDIFRMVRIKKQRYLVFNAIK